MSPDELAAILVDGEPSTTVGRSIASSVGDATHKVVDPVALTGVILAFPGAVLSAMDIADRISKRRKADQLVAAAKRLSREKRVTITVAAADGTTRSLDQLQADTVLELAGRPGTES